jgi:protein-S-isoprenylcysteine O-methyltransferase Ste14
MEDKIATKTPIFTVLVPGTFTVLVPCLILPSDLSLFTLKIGWHRFIGWAPLILGGLAYLRCARDFTISGKGTPAPIDSPTEMVVRGLYRVVRNPMYIGISLLWLGVAMPFESGALLIYAVSAMVIFHVFVRYYEEPALRQKFGIAYERYCGSVPRWIPHFQKWSKR